MSKLIMLVGLPASGKSTYAKELSLKEDAIILSSDKLRQELYGNINDTEHSSEIFEELHRRAKYNLKQGKNVIYDATNITSKKRRVFLCQLKGKDYIGIEKICYYFATPFKKCIHNNIKRGRQVPLEVIKTMYKSLQIPMYYEGWDKINIISSVQDDILMEQWIDYKTIIEEVILNDSSYEKIFNLIYLKVIFKDVYELPHDSSYHSFSVSRHIYHTYKYIWERYNKEENLVMLWTALLHDIGKGFCKNFKQENKYANFIGHDNVSSQLAIYTLKELGYDDDFTLKVATLVQLHMRISWDNNLNTNENLLKLVGRYIYDRLELLRIADKQAK